MFALAVLIVRDVDAAGPPGSYAFRSYGPDQGLRNQAVTSLAQDPDGFVYVGTEDGLFRYDGERFVRMGASEGLPSEGVTLLHPSNDDVWVATEKGLVAWKGLARDPAFANVLLPGTQVLGVTGARDGRLLVATASGFFEGNGRRLSVIAALPREAGAAWMSDDGAETDIVVAGRLYVRRDGRWRSQALPNVAAGEAMQSIVRDGRGRIWIRGRQLLLRLARFGAPFEDLTAQLPGAAVQKGELLLDRAGRVWAPTNHGIASFDGEARSLIDVAHGLPNEWATTLLVDREGSLWVGSEGVQQLQGRLAWTSFTRRQGLPSDTVWGVFRDRDGTLWAATNRGVARAVGDRWESLPGTQDRSFYAFAESTQGDLWIGGNSGRAGHNTLLYRAPGAAAFSPVALSSANGPSTINSMVFAPGGALYVATIAHGLHRAQRAGEGFAFAQVALPDGSPDEQVNQLARDARGRLWAAGMRGLAMFDGLRWRRFTTREGLLENQVETVTPADGDVVWLSYWNVEGLTAVHVDAAGTVAMQHRRAPDGLTGDTIYSAGYQAPDILWLGTAMGIKRWRAGRTEHFGRADGLPGEDAAANGFWADPDGDVWFGMANGLAHYMRRNEPGAPPPPPTFVTVVQDTGGRAIPASGEVRWTDRALTFHFATLGFLDPGRLDRQVRLEGFEDAWRDTSVSEARYTGLLPGRYVFQVRSRYGAGAFGPIASRAVVVLPPWWLTWWFVALAVVSLVLLSRTAMRWRLARLRRRNAELEGLVGARTRDLQAAYVALEEASMVDPLTGLKNRRYLSAFMPEELARCMRQQQAVSDGNIDLCVFLLDVDHFKAVNDVHGHAAGDAVLLQLGEVLRRTCRDSDVVVRWGGEEFLILARNANRHQAQVIAAQVCDAVRAHRFVLDDGTVLRKTCSMGFTAFPLLRGLPRRFGWEQAIELVDQCLYAAKHSGRDGWVGCLLEDATSTRPDEARQDIPGYGPARVSTSFPDAAALEPLEGITPRRRSPATRAHDHGRDSDGCQHGPNTATESERSPRPSCTDS